MNKRFTHGGDFGDTEVYSGERVSKSDIRIETLGELDELQSVLGLLRSLLKNTKIKKKIRGIQDDLRVIMSVVAAGKAELQGTNSLNETMIEKLENEILEYQEKVELPEGFITPGDDLYSALFDLARTVTRRVERRVVNAYQGHVVGNELILRYMNRLSTLMFFLELFEVKQARNIRAIRNHIV